MKILDKVAKRLQSQFNIHKSLIDSLATAIQNISGGTVNIYSKDVGDYFENAFYKPISPSFPAICLSRLSDTDTKTALYTSTNIPSLFPLLYAEKWKFNDTENISYSSYTIAAQTVLTLTAANNALINDVFLATLREAIYYHNVLDRGASLVAQNYIDLNLNVLFKGVMCRIVGFNTATRQVTLDYSTIGQVTASGNIQVFPYRIADTEVNQVSTIQIRKLREETSIASGYNSGTNLENRMQGFKVQSPNNLINQSPGGFEVLVSGNNVHSWQPSTSTIITDNPNGTVRTGKTARGNLTLAKIYLWAGVYNAG